MRQAHRPSSAFVCLTLTAVITAGCASGGPRQTQLMQTTNMTVSSAQLRVEVRSLADRFSGIMETTGDRILAGTNDPVIRHKVLRWYTNGIPAMQQALFQPDPLAALLDGWFLIAQMRNYFDAPTDGVVPAVGLDVVNWALDEMEADIKLIVDNSGPDADYEAGRQFVYEAAKNYPIDSGFAARRGSTAMLAEFTARTGGGALRSIGSITETVEDLVARIDLNAEYIPKFARWQAQLLIMDDIKGDEDYEALISSVQQLQHLELVADFLEDLDPLILELPDLVADEREAVLDALHTYLRETLAFVETQRTALMHEDVRSEREAILAAVRDERLAVLAAIAEERRIVLEAVSQERAAVFTDLNALMDEAFTREINKLFSRALILIAVLLGGIAVIAFFGVRALKSRGS